MSLPLNPSQGQIEIVNGTRYQCTNVNPNQWKVIGGNSHELRLRTLEGFKSVAEMRAGVTSRDSGSKVRWSGYYAESDGGGNWGIVKVGDSTSLVDDGGSIFVIVNDAVNGVWVESNLSGEKINLRKFGATPAVADCSDIIINAIAYCTSNNKALYAPSGKYRYSKDITFTCSFFGDGTELTHLVKIAPATIYVTKDDFKGVRVAPETDEIMVGDTSNGVVANDIWRKRIEVRTEYHGGDGFIFERGNLSQVVVYTNRNGGRGYVAAEDPISGDNNCVDMWVEASRNTSTGFEIESSTTDSHKANCLRGYVISQTNGTTGDPDKDFNVILDGFNHSDLMIYAEFGGNSVWLKEGLGGSDIFLSVASVLGIRDDLTAINTNTISYTPGARGDRRTKSLWLESLKIKNGVDVGNLELKQTGDRAFELNAEGSGSTQTLKVGSTLKLVNSDSLPFTVQEFKGATLNFGTLLANGGTGELSVTLNNPLPANIGVVYANPAYSLPNGIVYNCYMQDDSTVIIRCTNVTSGDISIPQGAWRVAAMNHA